MSVSNLSNPWRPNSSELKSQIEKTSEELNGFKCSTSTSIEKIKQSLNIVNTSNFHNAEIPVAI